MNDIIKTYQARFRRNRHMFRRYAALLLALAMITTLFVNWQLHGVGISMTADYQCGEMEHTHTEDCYTKMLVCGYNEGELENPDQAADTGTDDSTGSDDIALYDVPQTEWVPHEHTDACYTDVQVLTCSEEEHVHDDDCFDPEDGHLICDKFEHTHDEDCYTTEQERTCGLEEGELVEQVIEPTEGAALFGEATAQPVAVELPVDTTEPVYHHHTDSCYEEVLTCPFPEHHHTVECLSDTDADVGVEDTALEQAEAGLNGIWSEDLLTVAKSQLGYEQSEKNFQLDVDDHATVRHYTRYGESYGNPYGEWDVMFLSYCLKNAGIPQEAVPQEAGVLALRAAMKDMEWFQAVDADAAALDIAPGDIVVYEKQATRTVAVDTTQSDSIYAENGTHDSLIAVLPADSTTAKPVDVGDFDLGSDPDTPPETTTRTEMVETVGIVEEVDEETGALTVISGDVDGKVAEVQLAMADIKNMISVTAAQLALSGDSGADTMDGPHQLETVAKNLEFKLQKLVNGQWKDVPEGGTITDDDTIRVEINYEMPHTTITADANSITYKLPAGVNIPGGTSGYLSGTVGTTTRHGASEADSWGSYTVDADGNVTIQYNDDFLNTNDNFNGTLFIQGKVSLDGSSSEKKFKFTTDGKEYTILPKEEQSDLKVEKTAVKNEDGTISYTVTATSTTGTKENVKLDDTVSWNGLKNYELLEPTVKKSDGTTLSKSDYINYTEKSDEGGFTLELPPLGAGESYTVTYTAKYGDVASGSGYASAYNKVIGYDGKNWKDSKDTTTEIHKTVLEKTGSVTDNNSMVQWTIKVNQNRLSDVAGTWNIKDALNGTTIDWSKVTDFTVKETNNGWQWSDSTAFDKTTGKLTVAGGYAYEITYKTPIDYNGGSSTTETNHVDMDKDGTHYEADASQSAYKSDLFKEKKAANQKVAEEGKTVQQTWTITLNPPKGGSEALTITDVMYDQSRHVDPDVHWTTKALLEDACKDYAQKNIDYTLKCYDENGSEVTNNTDKVVRFELTLKPAEGYTWDGDAKHLNYKSLFSIEKLDDGETQTVWNEATVNGVSHDASASYTKVKRLHKYVEDQGWHEGNWTVDYDTAAQELTYRIVILPDNTDEQTVVDTLPTGMEFVEDSVEVRFYANSSYTYPIESGYDITAEENKPTVTINGQEMTVRIKSGFPKELVTKGLGFVITYKARVNDSFWDDFGNVNNPYSNTVLWNSKQETQTTLVERKDTTLIKDGVQEVGDNGSKTNKIKYWVVINAAGKKLNNGSPLTLTDTLTADHVSITLDSSSTKLYGFKAANKADHYKGDPLTDAAFQFYFDEAAKKFTVTVPDETPCVLEYVYIVENWNNYTSATLTNSAELVGEGTTTTDNTITINEATSGGTVSKSNVLTLIKVDEDRYQIPLKGAEFSLWRHNGYGDSWTELSTMATTGEDGTAQIKLTGYLRDRLYKAVEEVAPDGYKKRDTPYYFVPLESTTTEDAWWNAHQSSLPAGVQRSDIIFVEYNGYANVYVPNKSTTLKVQKLWLDSTGNPTTGQDIRVQLYQNAQKLEESKTVTVRFAGWNYAENFAETAYQIKAGTDFTFKIAGNYSNIQVDGTEVTLDHDPYGQYSFYTIQNITQDTTILLKGGWYGCGTGSLQCVYTEAQYISAGATAYGNPVTLTASEDYTHIWKDLPDQVNGAPVYYTVQELDVPSGYTVSYLNNEGIVTGTIVITNKQNPPPPGGGDYELPSTGGTGTLPFTVAGGTLMLTALVYGVRRKRRHEGRAD